MSIRNILNNTFQYPTSRKSRIIIAAFIGSFVFLFLSIFQPFNLWNVEIERRYFVTLGYGIIVFTVVFVNHCIAYRYFKNNFISTAGLIAWYLINSITVATLSSSFNDLIFNNVLFTFDSFIKFQYFIFTSLLIPTIILIITIRSNRIKNTYLIKTKHTNLFINQVIVIHAENPSNDFKIDISGLLYITSVNNYIKIFYSKNEKIKFLIIRSTLKNAEEDLKEYSNFFRCHKGFIVNLIKVFKVSKDASGIKLHLNETEETIPVSRNLTKTLRARLKEYTC